MKKLSQLQPGDKVLVYEPLRYHKVESYIKTVKSVSDNHIMLEDGCVYKVSDGLLKDFCHWRIFPGTAEEFQQKREIQLKAGVLVNRIERIYRYFSAEDIRQIEQIINNVDKDNSFAL